MEVPALSAGEIAPERLFSYQIPAGMPPGSYDFQVWLDPGSVIVEAPRTSWNNKRYLFSAFQVVPRGAQPDLAKVEAQALPAVVAPNELVNLSLKVANAGNAPSSPTKVQIFFHPQSEPDPFLTTGPIISVAAGSIDSKYFFTTDATKSPGEPSPCDHLGGASKWVAFQPEADGILEIDTIGSTFDTILGVYDGSSLLNFEEIACDDNGAPNGRSRVQFPAFAGRIYLVVVDGVKGAKGNVNLSWNLVANSLRLAYRLEDKNKQFQVTGGITQPILIQKSFDLINWLPASTNYGGRTPFQLFESLTNAPKTFYRFVPYP